MVLGRGGTDNVTIVLVRIRGALQADLADRTAVPAERALP
jgi:hypothetical protein